MVIALHGIIQLVSNTTRSYVFRVHLKKDIVKEFGMGAFLGLSASTLIIFILVQLFNVESANEIKVEFLKPLIGLFIIWYLFLKGPKKEKHAKSFIGVGALSGVSSVFVGATGPLIKCRGASQPRRAEAAAHLHRLPHDEVAAAVYQEVRERRHLHHAIFFFNWSNRTPSPGPSRLGKSFRL